MQKHYRSVHGWVNKQRKGGSLAQRRRAHDIARPWRTGVRCQRFFNRGPRQEYFEVSGAGQPYGEEEQQQQQEQGTAAPITAS